MGVNKKFLILSLLLVIASNTYSITNGEIKTDQNVDKDKTTANWANGEMAGTTTLKEGVNVNISGGATGVTIKNQGQFENKGTLSVSGKGTNESKGINFGKGNINTENKAVNNGKIKVQSQGIGVYFGIDGEFKNKSNITVLGENSKGIYLNSQGTAINEGSIYVGCELNEKGEIVAGSEKAIGVQVSNASAEFTNKATGNIYIQGDSKGIQINNGKATNEGNIIATVSKATGIYINGKDGNFENKEKAQILVSGAEAKGVHFGANGGTANNAGTIEVTSEGIGAYFGGNGTFNNLKDIVVSGVKSKGIYLNSKGTAKNEGNIFVGYKVDDTGNIILGEEGAIGVQVNNSNAQFTNNKDANIKVAGGSQGIQVNKGKAINQGIIEATAKNATGVYMHGETGNFENTNRIEVSGESSKGIFFGVDGGKATNNGIINVTNQGTGVFSYKGKLDGDKPTPSKNQNNFTNGKDGTINVYGKKSVGLLLDTLNDKGKIVNEGTINIYDQGTGVKLGGTTFTNSGTIEVKNSGIAIESVKDTNNTLVLKNGSKIKGNIQGNTGVDVLVVEGGGEYKDLSITSYDKIVSLKNENSTNDAVISNSNISLGFNQGTDNYINGNKELNGDKTGLTIKNSNLVVDLTNKIEGSSLVDTGDGKLTLDGNMKIAFNGGNGEKEFNISEILGDEIVANNAKFESSAMWDYTTENGDLIAKKKSYTEAVGKSQLEDFGKALEQSENGKIEDGDFKTGLTLLGLLDASQFTDAMTQLSGGVHGYTVDFAAINSRTLSNTIKNRELNKDRLRDKALNSYDQEVAYINNHHKIGGLMNVDYNEDGILGITEKQIMPNGKLGLVYGGAKGKAKFENGKHGKANMDNLYLGGYYAYDFTDKLTLVSNANFVYSHTNVTRNIKFSKEWEDSKLEQTYDSTYPVFGFGGGATLYYTPYNSLNNSVTLYGGIDWTKVVQGNINEDSDNAENKTNVTIKNLPADEQMYDSVVPHIGLSLSNNGYIFNRKYRLGVNVDYETELGNIKNGKKLKLSALSTPHRVETAERENIVSYSLNGALDLTEDFTIYGNYTKADSDEYDAERVEAGFKYKMDRMSDLFVTGPLLGNIENSKPYSRRWTGVASFILDGEDDSDRSYYNHIDKDSNQSHSRGDYATSLKLKPKFTLSLNDRDTKWSYYFETYYMSNGMGMNLDKNERRKSESRIHAEARWSDQYSKGRYGFNIGYRNEITSSPTLSQYVQRDRLTRGLHQFRFTPNFTYNLGNGFIFGGSTTGIIAYDYEGYRKGQTDFELENEYGITYNGLMPRWRFNVNYFREETWYDNDFRKPSVKGEVEGDRRYQSNQLRPRITYFFGNGGRVELSARMPLGNGYWYNSDDNNKKTAEKYETRYGIKYYQPITPGLTGMIGGEILTIKTKNTDHGNSNYGKETRDYSIRPTIGISYNF